MFTSVCLQFERELKLRTNNQCLIIISHHVHRLVFIPMSVYCERLILACVCYSTAITGWCVLILNFCASSFFCFAFLFIFRSNVFRRALKLICIDSRIPTATQLSGRHRSLLVLYLRHYLWILLFFQRQGECWCLLTQLLLSVKPAITAVSFSTLNIA